MISKRLTIVAVGIGILISAAGTTSAYAWVKHFPGTRDQVRTACKAVGGYLAEGRDNTTCIGSTTGVTCGDDGNCVGSGAGPMPRQSSDFVILGLGTYATQGAQTAGGGASAPRTGSLSTLGDLTPSGGGDAPSGGGSGGEDGGSGGEDGGGGGEDGPPIIF